MSAQLSVEREGSGSLYIEGGVSSGGVILSFLRVPITNVSGQVKHYVHGQSRECLQRAKQLCFGQRLDAVSV
jgi:hypothetical protein